MSEQPIRYRFHTIGKPPLGDIKPCPDGELVNYSSYVVLEQRVKELETNLFAATATVGDLEDKLVEVERERDAYKQDIHDEAGLLMVDVPEPGTDMAKVMRANRLMRHSRDRLRNSLFKLDAMTPKHPREITWEKGTEILNYVQGELLPQLWTKQALKEERSGR